MGKDPRNFSKRLRDLAVKLRKRLDEAEERGDVLDSNPYEWEVMDEVAFKSGSKDHETRWIFGVSVDDLVYSGMREDFAAVPARKDPMQKFKMFIMLESTMNIDANIDKNRTLNSNGYFDFNIGISVPLEHGITLFEGDDYMAGHKEAVFVWEEGMLPLLASGMPSKVKEFNTLLSEYRSSDARAAESQAFQDLDNDEDLLRQPSGEGAKGGGKIGAKVQRRG